MYNIWQTLKFFHFEWILFSIYFKSTYPYLWFQSSSPEPLDQFQPFLIQSILAGQKGFKFIQMKGLSLKGDNSKNRENIVISSFHELYGSPILKWWKWQMGAPVRWVPLSFQFGNFFLFLNKLYTYWRCAYFMDINFSIIYERNTNCWMNLSFFGPNIAYECIICPHNSYLKQLW